MAKRTKDDPPIDRRASRDDVKEDGRPKERPPVVPDSRNPDGVATREEAAGALLRVKARLADDTLVEDPEKLFSNRTEIIVKARNESVVALSKQRGAALISWFSSSAPITTAEFEADLAELRSHYESLHGSAPIGLVFSTACPYLRENPSRQVATNAIATLVQVFGARNLIVPPRPAKLEFPAEDASGTIIGIHQYDEVLAYYLPTGRISIGVE